jgi:magnesium chelatase family protein
MPLEPVPSSEMSLPRDPNDSTERRRRVLRAIEEQRKRYRGLGFSWNSRIPPGLIERFCELEPLCRDSLVREAEKNCLSSRAYHSVLRIARTIADLAGEPDITVGHIEAAVELRKFGDGNFFWASGR